MKVFTQNSTVLLFCTFLILCEFNEFNLNQGESSVKNISVEAIFHMGTNGMGGIGLYGGGLYRGYGDGGHRPRRPRRRRYTKKIIIKYYDNDYDDDYDDEWRKR